METTQIDPTPQQALPPARPSFLSVLCILTWICSGLVLISTLWRVLVPETPESQMEKVEQIRQYNPEAADQMEVIVQQQIDAGPGRQIAANVIALIALAFSVTGAYMMWQLKKRGFYLYLVGELLPYLSFAFGGMDELKAAGSMSGMGSAMAGIVIGVMLLFDLVFIIMYAVNLKYMTR